MFGIAWNWSKMTVNRLLDDGELQLIRTNDDAPDVLETAQLSYSAWDTFMNTASDSDYIIYKRLVSVILNTRLNALKNNRNWRHAAADSQTHLAARASSALPIQVTGGIFFRYRRKPRGHTAYEGRGCFFPMPSTYMLGQSSHPTFITLVSVVEMKG